MAEAGAASVGAIVGLSAAAQPRPVARLRLQGPAAADFLPDMAAEVVVQGDHNTTHTVSNSIGFYVACYQLPRLCQAANAFRRSVVCGYFLVVSVVM